MSRRHPGEAVIAGVDVGKFELRVVLRWAAGEFERPWRVANAVEVPALVERLEAVASGRSLRVALEPSGTYGDALRQALFDAGIVVERISQKVAHDYAEVFDGVPSQHDGKDAAVVAELAAQGKGRVWVYQQRDAWSQELTYWVSRLESQRRIAMLWLGQVEGLLGRHWPEATRVLKVSSRRLCQIDLPDPSSAAARKPLSRFSPARLTARR